ncbi:MAG: DUF6242 domain-containing protein [Dysgonamonadaceae bacterium]|nr:DUF6242 domain-containing protein [Dysgonamonadaceae bacterium]MDD3355642.1 DUF6242 domain-containing protein [Dysgonamonadaceae bacterium]MDD3727344.1 DUF6242 domain-containing protein [Dysgonamonadaceae bacterium]MDD4245920.1 DUF6242 domain-containing protein [Dysgonamonadaceae bacterium]MDD4605414.1 DUF6242 domain-containing protein [Dysgonamonadaceae bacterium]
MISNWFYYCFTLLATTILLSSCLDSNEVEYTYSADAQMTSLKISSSEDSLGVLSKVEFSINQVSSAPVVFNKDSLPYLFDVENVKMEVTTNGASGIKLYLINPDSSYIWNLSDSVKIKKLKQIEIFAQDGKTTKRYTFELRTHQQDPDTIFWQNVKNNYIDLPTDQVTVADKNQFYTYYQTGNAIKLSTSSIEDGTNWTNQVLNGMPQNVLLSSIQTIDFDNNVTWYATDSNNKLYESANGIDWSLKATTYPVKAIYGKLPSFTKDSILLVLKDGSDYKFAKTNDFSSLRVLNSVPSGFPITAFTFTSINDPLIYSAKYLIVTGGENDNNFPNRSVWVLQENENKINSISNISEFNVTGSSLFNYDGKIYLMTSKDNENVFYTSINYGIFWEKANSKQSLPAGFTNRTSQSVTVDSKNNIWIFGGKTNNQTQLVEVWKGRINKLFTK